MSTTAEQTSVLDAATTNGKKTPQPVKLASAHDFSLTTQALEHRSEELKKLVKKNQDEGYHREARAIEADVAAIEHAILPQFRSQRELPLASTEELEIAVEGALRVFIFRAFDKLDDPKAHPTGNEIRGRRDRLVETLAQRVTLFARDVAEEAFNQGYAIRQTTPEAIAARSVRTLRNTAD